MALVPMARPRISAGFKTPRPMGMPKVSMPKPMAAPKAGRLSPTGGRIGGTPSPKAPRIPAPSVPKVPTAKAYLVAKGIKEIKRISWSNKYHKVAGGQGQKFGIRPQHLEPDYARGNRYLFERSRAANNGRHLAREIARARKSGHLTPKQMEVPKTYQDRRGRYPGDTIGMYADFGRENRADGAAWLERKMKDRVQPRRLP